MGSWGMENIVSIPIEGGKRGELAFTTRPISSPLFFKKNFSN